MKARPKSDLSKIGDLITPKMRQWFASQIEAAPEDPSNCVCGCPYLRNEAEAEEGVIYCDKTIQWVVVSNMERTHKEFEGRPHGRKFINYGPTRYAVGRCPFSERIPELKDSYSQKLKNMRFDTFMRGEQPEAYDIAERYTSGNLVLTGPTGTGKTHLARSIYIRLKSEGTPAAWATALDLKLAFVTIDSATYDAELMEEAVSFWKLWLETKYLFVDDLGNEGESRLAVMKAFFRELLEKRSGSTIISINCDAERIAERYGEPVLSRLTEQAAIIKTRGRDFRNKTEEINE